MKKPRFLKRRFKSCRSNNNEIKGALVYSSENEISGDIPLIFDTEVYDTDNIHDVVTTPSESFQTSRFVIPRGVGWAKLEARAVVRLTHDRSPVMGFRKNWEFDSGDLGIGKWKIKLPIATTEDDTTPASFMLHTPWMRVKEGDIFDLWLNDSLDSAGYVLGTLSGTWFSIELR